MPNYGLVVTPQYNPMNYEQYAKPFEEYGKAYNAMADAYDTLEMEANQWEKLAQNAKDKPEYDRYKKYADDLRLAADDLASNGLNQRTRGTLSNLRKRYAQEIKPIADAYAYREKMADEQRTLNPTGDIQFDTDFSNIGLGAIMANPNLSYRGRSLADIEKEAFEQAKSFSSRSLETRKATELGSQYYQILQGVGQDAADAFLQRVRNGTNSNFTVKDLQALDDLYQEIRDARGTSATNSPYSEEQNALADDRILSGMMKGLTLADSYQTNHWALPGAGRSSGSGSSKSDARPLIYNIDFVKDGKVTPYRYVDKGNGNYELYDITTKKKIGNTDNIGEPVKDEKGNIVGPYAKYGVVSTGGGTNENSYIVDLTQIDARTGQPFRLTDEDNKVITLNPGSEDINPVTLKIEGKQGTNVDVPKLSTTRIIVGGTKGLWGDPDGRYGKTKTLNKNEIDALKEEDRVTYDSLTDDEKALLPEEVKANLSHYLFYKYSDDDPGMIGTGDNDYLVYKYVQTNKVKTSDTATEQTEEGNDVPKMPKKKEG